MFHASIYCLMANHAKGLIISGDFRGGGRPPICSDTDMKQIAESFHEEVGKTYGKSDVKMMIKKIQTEKLEEAGYKIIIDKSICDSTLRNYSALLANEGKIAISQSNISADELCCLQDSDSLLSPTPYKFFQCAWFSDMQRSLPVL
jgi:hypothetical protein